MVKRKNLIKNNRPYRTNPVSEFRRNHGKRGSVINYITVLVV